MGYIWDVEPKSFTDEVGETRTIVGIMCSAVSAVEYSRNEFKVRDLWIAFVQDSGSLYNPRYFSSNDLVQKLIENGETEADAQAEVKSILKGLDYGTLAEIELNAQKLAEMYGYSLLQNNNN
jgi:hypothetical protein